MRSKIYFPVKKMQRVQFRGQAILTYCQILLVLWFNTRYQFTKKHPEMLNIELRTASNGTTTYILTKTCIKCCLKNTRLVNDQLNIRVKHINCFV